MNLKHIYVSRMARYQVKRGTSIGVEPWKMINLVVCLRIGNLQPLPENPVGKQPWIIQMRNRVMMRQIGFHPPSEPDLSLDSRYSKRARIFSTGTSAWILCTGVNTYPPPRENISKPFSEVEYRRCRFSEPGAPGFPLLRGSGKGHIPVFPPPLIRGLA